ncbi:MAG TPA: biotin/lipoyl-binding protein [Tepidisphaeraceae bacterium]|jgi:HlyD family secretion protein|nr:biotin/lipoyl-binding protein [Tepidisphaeraceae bacterium]
MSPSTGLRNWTKLALACGIAASAWALAGNTTAPTTSPAAADLPSSYTAVHRGNLDLALDFKGVFDPVQSFEVRLNPRRYHDDFIIHHVVAPGMKVSKGDVLLELDTDKIDAAIAAAQNELNIARANLAKAQSDVRLGEQADAQSMSTAKQQLVDSQTTLKRWDDIDSSIALLANSMVSRFSDYYVENDTDELNELKKMYKSEDLTNETADIVMKRAVRVLDLEKLTSKTAHAATERYADFEAAVQREQLVNGVDQQSIGVAQLNAAQVQGSDLRQTSLVTAQAAEEEARKNFDQLQRDREFFSVASGIDGVVVYGSFQQKAWKPIEPAQLAPGEKVQADQVLLTVYSPGKLGLIAECPENQVGYFSAGTKVRITPQAMPDLTYDGTCRTPPVISETQGSEQIFNIAVDLPPVDQRLAPGYRADVNYNAGDRRNVLLVPVSAVWRDKVWISKPGSSAVAEPRSVVIGASDGRNVEIKSGLSEGEIVLTEALRPAAR